MTESLIIICVVLVSYFSSLKNSYIVDDIRTFKTRYNNQKEYSLKTRFERWGIPGIWRFVTERLYGACTFTYNIEKDNAFRIVLWAFACVMVYLGLSHLFDKKTAFYAALLYSIHPLNNQLSLWANGRRYVINLILFMSMLVMGQENPLTWIAYLVTLSFHVSAIFAPLSFGFTAWIIMIAGAFVVALPSIRRKIKDRVNRIHDAARRKINPVRLIVTVKQYGHYFFKMIFPNRCQMTYEHMYFWGITKRGNDDAYAYNREFWIGAGALVLSGALLCFVPWDKKGAVAFLVLGTLQWCAIVPFLQDMADRYASLPNVFMMGFISYFINSFLPEYSAAIISAIFVYYLINLFTVKLMYRSIGHFFEYHRFFSPALVAPRKDEIKHLLSNNDFNRAWVYTQDGLRHNPNDYILLFQAAACLRGIGAINEARMFAQTAANNFYLNQEHVEGPKIKIFLESLDAKPVAINRQMRRAMERADKKKKEKQPLNKV